MLNAMKQDCENIQPVFSSPLTVVGFEYLSVGIVLQPCTSVLNLRANSRRGDTAPDFGGVDFVRSWTWSSSNQ
jgi:hypothetical protein